MLGESAGRAPAHRVRSSSRRRFTERERAANTPLPDDVQEWPNDEVRLSKIRESLRDVIIGFAAVVLMLVLVSIYNHVPDWRGMAALSFLGSITAALAIATFRRR